jgi:Uma2 family endonuclease
MTHDETERDYTCTCYPTLPLTPPDGWTLDNLPLADLPKRTELIRGVLVMSPQTSWHAAAVGTLQSSIGEICPAQYEIEYRMAIRKTPRTAPEPDLSIVRADAHHWDKSCYLPEEVLLAAEVISPESEERDREDKPILYGTMGIPTFWLIERGKDNAPMVHEHRLIDGGYRLMKTHIGRLTTDIPFPIDIPLFDPTA